MKSNVNDIKNLLHMFHVRIWIIFAYLINAIADYICLAKLGEFKINRERYAVLGFHARCMCFCY